MVIVYIIDSYGEFSNGTTITAKRSKEYLEAMGHKVRIVSISKDNSEDFYSLDERKIPIVSHFANKQSMHFAKPNRQTLEEALEGADLVHIFLPFKAGKMAIKVANKLNIPVTAAFHMQPEHITYAMGLDRYGLPLSSVIYRWLNMKFYKKVTHIHCPSEFIRDRLNKSNYKNIFHVISNGVQDKFYITPERDKEPEIFKILSIGRYSKEKRQETLLKAVSLSKHKDKIEITLAGKGPREKKLKKLANKLNLNVKFVFLTQDELLKVISESHLYVHPAEAEIEGMSALEAISTGLVPLVAVSKNSATSQFTITEESRFKVRDYKELSSKIDYFIKNSARRLELEELYRSNMDRYKIETSMKLMEELFKEAVFDYKKSQSCKTPEGKVIKKKIVPSRWRRFLSFLFYYAIAIPVFWIYLFLIRGVKIKGKQNLKMIKKNKKGSVVITNHVHHLDSVMTAFAIFPRRAIYTALPENTENKFFGFLVRGLGGRPIPTTPTETKIFFINLKNQITKGKHVHFFPEGELTTKAEEIAPFKRGAFVLAEEAKVPVLPVKIKFEQKKNKFRFPFFFKERIIVEIGEPIKPNIYLTKRQSSIDMQDRAYEAMNKL